MQGALYEEEYLTKKKPEVRQQKQYTSSIPSKSQKDNEVKINFTMVAKKPP